MHGLRHNNPTSLQIFENILLDATLVKPFKNTHSFEGTNHRGRVVIYLIRLIDYEYEPMGAALQFLNSGQLANQYCKVILQYCNVQ